MRFANVLKGYRETAELTQEELAARAGLGVNTIGNLERGINTSPHRSTLRRLSVALALDPEESDALAAAARPAVAPAVITGGFLGARPSSRLIGREPELDRLRAAETAVEDGEGRLLMVTGEAGVGKTRLAQEASVHAWERGFLVAAGRCYEGRSGIPYFPFLEALETIAHDSEEFLAGRPRVDALLSTEGPEAEPINDEAEALRLLREITGLVKEAAARRPLTLLLDDLQWADGASIALLAHLARHTRGDRVLLVGTARDLELPHDHPLTRTMHELDREQLTERIPCGRLGVESTVDLVHDLLPGASADLSSRIHAQTDGNPFFVVEVVRGVTEHGEASPIPAGIRAAILDRTGSIGPPGQALLEAAAVLGLAFPVADLLDLTEGAGLDRALDAVIAGGLLRQAGDVYSFDHALTQQTLYAEMSATRRRDLHLAVAACLEPFRAAEIGWHLVRGGAPRRALPHLIRAGERAQALFANEEALRHYREALEIAERVGDAAATATALERLGGILVTVADYDEGLALLERAASTREDTIGLALIEARIAEAHFRRGTSTQGAERLRDRLAALDRPDLDPDARNAVAGLYGALARLCFARLEYEGCCDAARRVAQLATDEALLASAAMIDGTALIWLDESDRGLATLERSIAAAERSGALGTLSTALLSLHRLVLLRGEFDRGSRAAARGAVAAERLGDPQLMAMHSTNLGLQHFYSGNWSGAEERLGPGADPLREARLSIFACTPPAYLGVLRAGQGRTEEAASLFAEAIELATAAQIVAIERYALCRLAEIDRLRGAPDEAIRRLAPLDSEHKWIYDVLFFSVLAEAHADLGELDEGTRLARQALESAAVVGNRVEGIDASRALARCLRLQGRAEEAEEVLAAAIEAAAALPYPYGEARLLLERAELTGWAEPRAAGRAILSRLRGEAVADPGADRDCAIPLEAGPGRL